VLNHKNRNKYYNYYYYYYYYCTTNLLVIVNCVTLRFLYVDRPG